MDKNLQLSKEQISEILVDEVNTKKFKTIIDILEREEDLIAFGRLAVKNKFPCLSHRISDNKTINLINYLTHGWHQFKEHRFLGFIVTYEDAVESLIIDGKNYIACVFL